MAGKHLKRKRAEKAKVHLKKKKLPKGQNITDTSFKVKKIVTVEQLKKVDENEPVSNWNVTLKDLLIRLNHYNYTSRLNSLSGIKEILTKYPEIVLGPSLKPLISRLLELITDEEHKIRITAMELVSYLLGSVPHDSIIPFCDILNVHLACAMTHRNTSVQHDALKYIDVIIKHVPEALKHNLEMITQNFLRIIKTYLYESETGGFSTKGIELEKAKTEMLVRFYEFLVAGYSDKTAKEADLRNMDKNVMEKQKISLKELCNDYKKVPNLSDLFKNSETKGEIIKVSSSVEVKSLCSLVMPVLFGTWREFSPNQRSESSECVLTEAVGDLLCVIVQCILFLQEKILALQDPNVEFWFSSAYSETFKKSFTSNFPYFPSISKKKSKSNTPKESLNTYLKQNLIICYLSYSLKLVHKNKDLEIKIEDYISGVLSMKNPTELNILTKVIEIAISTSKLKNPNILNMAITAHKTTNNSQLRQNLSKALTLLALEDIENLSQGDCTVRNWMASIPHHLCNSQIFVHEIEAILKMISKSTGSDILREIELRAEEITDNLPHVRIEGMDELEGQRMIARILYRCNNDVLKRIVEKVSSGETYSEPLRHYILEIFNYKLNCNLGTFNKD